MGSFDAPAPRYRRPGKTGAECLEMDDYMGRCFDVLALVLCPSFFVYTSGTGMLNPWYLLWLVAVFTFAMFCPRYAHGDLGEPWFVVHHEGRPLPKEYVDLPPPPPERVFVHSSSS
jgi:hypothetical protein